MFKRFCHDHYFETRDGGTEMRDRMEFMAPFGWLGRVVEILALEQHMITLLQRRNAKIKAVAESEEWTRFLSPETSTKDPYR
jgi:ligand-binding SRPBCC domain-containing protein